VLHKCDVLVIGAGPAGATAAKSAAEAGAKTILMEKRKQVGVPVQCAEYVPHQMTQEVKLPEEVIAQRIDCMRTHMPDGEVVETAVRGFMIHRDFFDQHLADEAAKAGAGLLEAEAKEYKGGTVFALTKAGPLEIEAKLVVGADGPHSTAGKWINAQNKEFIQTAQHQMPLVSESKSTEVYFRKDIPVGYGWVFPKGKRANVGVGVNVQFGESPLKALRHFEGYLQQEGVIGNEVIKTIGGAIPVGGLVNRLYFGNVLLVGDAAGMAHPITGAGVSNAVLCGKMAGEIAGRAALEGDLGLLAEYEEECRLLLGHPLTRAWQKRKQIEASWRETEEEWLPAIRLSWIAFEDYWR